MENRPLRAVINDVFKSTATSVSICVKVEAGSLEIGEKVYIMPNADPGVVKSIFLYLLFHLNEVIDYWGNSFSVPVLIVFD